MRRTLSVGAAVLASGLAWAQVPGTIGFSGRLLSAAGEPVGGLAQVTFTLYDAATGGSSLWTQTQEVALAEGFYSVHRGKPFFAPLTEFMSSGKVILAVLEAENAIARWRDTMGATDPSKAAPGTIRREFGTSIQNNCTHGSDAPETAAFEISYFFYGHELR